MGTQGSCFEVTTSTIAGNGNITSGSFVSASTLWNWYKFQMNDSLDYTLTSLTASLNILSGSTGQAQLILIGAGGAGANVQSDGAAGGGAGGGVVYYNQFTLTSGSYEIGVPKANILDGTNTPGPKGGNAYFKAKYNVPPFSSSFVVGYGGGGGMVSWTLNNPPFYTPQYNQSTVTGGSAGGAAKTFNGTTQGGFAPQSNAYRNFYGVLQGNASGQATNNTANDISVATGGGGAGAASANADEINPRGQGGNGLLINLTGTPEYVAGGGGGWAEASANSKGLGGDNYGGGGTGNSGASGTENYGVAGCAVVLIPVCFNQKHEDCRTYIFRAGPSVGATATFYPCDSLTLTTASLSANQSASICVYSGSGYPTISGTGAQLTASISCDQYIPITSSLICPSGSVETSMSIFSYTNTTPNIPGTGLRGNGQVSFYDINGILQTISNYYYEPATTTFCARQSPTPYVSTGTGNITNTGVVCATYCTSSV